MRRLVVTLALLTAACGAAAERPVGGSPSTTVITRADDRRTVSATVGDTVHVSLEADLDWTVKVSDPAVLTAIPGVTLARGTQGSYRAARPGTAIVTGEGRPHCDPGQVCAQFIVSFEARVEVR